MECRFCSTITTIPTSIPIFEDSGSLVKQIWNCCQLKMEKHDNLPDRICLMCKSKIELFNTFKNVCIERDEMLKSRLIESFRIKPEEVLLDDLDWEKESPIYICDSSSDVNDEAIEPNTIHRNDNINFSRDWTENACNSIVDEKGDAMKSYIVSDPYNDANKSYDLDKNERIAFTMNYTENNRNFTVDAVICADDANNSNILYRNKETTSSSVSTGNTTHDFETIIMESSHKISRDKFKHLHKVNGNELNVKPPEPLPKLKPSKKPREYKCKRCPKRFKTVNLMVGHMNSIHIGNEPFKCEYCLRLFSSKQNLMSHVKIHTRQGLFKCPTCLKEFTSKAGLAKHIKNQDTNERKYRCNICSIHFTNEYYLSNHMKVMYNSIICPKSYALQVENFHL